jgi:hypothetical protein
MYIPPNVLIFNYTIDILLHESGHLMLSDFDLSIQSPTAALPTLVQPNSPFSVRRK